MPRSGSVSPGARRGTLVGRRHEQATLRGLLDQTRAGRSAVLVLRGEAGIGKTALLTELMTDSDGLRTISISGAESEMELAYAGVQQLCGPLVGRVDRLPDPQKRALRFALGLREGDGPDRFLVSLAVLTLLGEAGAEQPTVCVIDDAQWVDHASLQALAFVARRLAADPVAMLFAVREPSTERDLTGLPELFLSPLADTDARTLLTTLTPGGLDADVRENILAEANGNPLALLEFQRALAPAELAGGYGLATARPLVSRIERSFVERLL